MEIDLAKVDEAVIALLQFASFRDRGVTRAWKGQDWEVLGRLHEQGLILDPKNKSKSVVLTEEGVLRGREACDRLFRRTA